MHAVLVQVCIVCFVFLFIFYFCTVPGKPEVDPGHEDYADGRQVEVKQVVAQGSLEHNRYKMYECTISNHM